MEQQPVPITPTPATTATPESTTAGSTPPRVKPLTILKELVLLALSMLAGFILFAAIILIFDARQYDDAAFEGAFIFALVLYVMLHRPRLSVLLSMHSFGSVVKEAWPLFIPIAFTVIGLVIYPTEIDLSRWVTQIPVSVLRALNAGVNEELAYRLVSFGLLGMSFAALKRHITWATILSACLFAFVHVPTVPTNALEMLTWVAKFFETFVFAVVFIYIMVRTGSILIPIVLHTLFDGLTFLIGSMVVELPSSINYVQGENSLETYLGIVVMWVSGLVLVPVALRGWRYLRNQAGRCVSPLMKAFYTRELNWEKTAADAQKAA